MSQVKRRPGGVARPRLLGAQGEDRWGSGGQDEPSAQGGGEVAGQAQSDAMVVAGSALEDVAEVFADSGSFVRDCDRGRGPDGSGGEVDPASSVLEGVVQEDAEDLTDPGRGQGSPRRSSTPRRAPKASTRRSTRP